MSKPKKQYVVPIHTPEDKQRVRDWVGTHSGMSILKTDEVFYTEGVSLTFYDIYVLGITNPKTEMLFVLSFPEATKKAQFDDELKKAWEENFSTIVKA